MMLVVYGCIIALSWFGAQFIVAGNLTTGNLTSLFSYVMSVLMSLMMLSMIFVMITMSAASAKRIAEVLNEVSDLASPEEPETALADGSIDFNHVSFSYQHGSGEETLHDIDLHIRSGETIGIIGGLSLIHIFRLFRLSSAFLRFPIPYRSFPSIPFHPKTPAPFLQKPSGTFFLLPPARCV